MTTAVLLCADGLPRPNGTGDPNRCAVADLCGSPEQIRTLVGGAERLVLGLCGRRYSLGPVQREARRAGLDPIGVEIVDLDAAAGDVGRLEVLLSAAVARAEAFAGSRPEHAKIQFPTQTSRRALLTFALPEYVAAPAIDVSLCAADRGCRACVDVCPQKALTLTQGRVVYDRSVCEPCGRCVTACPTGATENPAATRAQLEAQLRALLNPAAGPPGPRGVVFRCRRSAHAETGAGWYPVTVPCTGMVPVAWLLAPLLLGAGTVAVRPCSHGGCPLRHDDLVRERVAWSREFLVAAGIAPERVTLEPDSVSPHAPLARTSLADPFGPVGAASVLLALCESTAAGEVRLDRPGASLGVVEIDRDACTVCGTCAATCPTGALAATDEDGRRSISFDAAGCVACGACVRRCPEVEHGAIRLRPAADIPVLRRGRVTLSDTEVATCRSCGRPVAPVALLNRLAALIGDERVLASVRDLCQDCRGRA